MHKLVLLARQALAQPINQTENHMKTKQMYAVGLNLFLFVLLQANILEGANAKVSRNQSFLASFLAEDSKKKWCVILGVGSLACLSGYLYVQLQNEQAQRVNESNRYANESRLLVVARNSAQDELSRAQQRTRYTQTELNQARERISTLEGQITRHQESELLLNQQITQSQRALLRLAQRNIMDDPGFISSLDSEDIQALSSLHFENGQQFWHHHAEQGNEDALWPLTDMLPRSSDGVHADESPLFKTVAEQKVKLAMHLLLLGADPNQPNRHGVCPLHIAVLLKNRALVNLLLAKKANVNTKTKRGLSPAYIASFFKDDSILRLILNADPDIIPVLNLLREQMNLIAYNRLCSLQFQQEAKCSICSNTMAEATKKMVSCCHGIFCHDCLTKSMKNCPNCRATTFSIIHAVDECNHNQAAAASSSSN